LVDKIVRGGFDPCERTISYALAVLFDGCLDKPKPLDTTERAIREISRRALIQFTHVIVERRTGELNLVVTLSPTLLEGICALPGLSEAENAFWVFTRSIGSPRECSISNQIWIRTRE
jgi:hypothetical protein